MGAWMVPVVIIPLWIIPIDALVMNIVLNYYHVYIRLPLL